MHEAPGRDEAAPYYFRYIDRIPACDIVERLDTQLGESLTVLCAIPEEKSVDRYAPDKWSMRQLLNHVNDTERVFLARAFWFARGNETPLPGFDQDTAAAHAGAHEIAWADHVADLRAVRGATVTFFRNLAPEAWKRSGIASDNPFTVRSLAYITAGHLDHHLEILRERYL